MDVTYNFTPGTRAVAQQVNTNFADVKSAVDVLETDVADLQAEVSGFSFIKADGSVDFTRLQSYATYVVSNATNATPIVVTAVAHSFLTGDKVYISGVGGNTAANGTFTITKIGADTFSLDGSVGNGSYTSGGIGYLLPQNPEDLSSAAYVDLVAGKERLVTICAAIPTLSAGIGQHYHAAGQGQIPLPAGGTWEWVAFVYNNNTGIGYNSNTSSGISAGGTLCGYIKGNADSTCLIARRIA